MCRYLGLLATGSRRSIFSNGVGQIHDVHEDVRLLQFEMLAVQIRLTGQSSGVALLAVHLEGNRVAAHHLYIGNLECAAVAVQPHPAPRNTWTPVAVRAH